MPFADSDIRVDLYRYAGVDGRAHCGIGVRVRAAALWPFGLHPDQPMSRAPGASPPQWWHAEAERRFGRG